MQFEAPTAPAPAPSPTVIAVRALCEFTAKAGDVDLRFTPSPTAEQGMAGHRIVAARRADGYRSELRVEAPHGHLLVRGRIDGYDTARRRLEEIKTHRGDLARMPANHRALHWAQAKVYGWLLCRAEGLRELDIALVYFDIDTGVETSLIERFDADTLRAFFERQCDGYAAWARQEAAHRARRDDALSHLGWPLGEFRSGQRDLAKAVFNAARSRRRLLAQAPTGIGKTMGVLFPLLKAAPGQGLDKVFFLTARTPGRQLALDAVVQLRAHAPRLPLRVLTLVARDQACEHPGRACHGESCPLARGFYDRLPAARAEAVDELSAGADAVRTVAQHHRVCPYYLAQDLVRWADVVIADYNYWFDLGGLLHALTQAHQWRIGLLVDEGHNLVARGRSMYSATLEPARLGAALAAAPAASKRALQRLRRQWSALVREQSQPYTCSASPPKAFVAAVQQTAAALGEQLAGEPAEVDPAFLRFHFDLLHFMRVHERHDENWQFDATLDAPADVPRSRGAPSATLCLRNVVPAPVLRERFAAAHCAVVFSATLAPARFYIDMLGLPDDTATLAIVCPFNPAHLQVRIARHISTRHADRAASLDALVALVTDQYARAPGNYIAFFSSFDYLQQVADRLALRHPGITLWRQDRSMAEAQRAAFLDRFQPGSQGIGFAVLGGVFGEGIDLPGSRLVGAFIATLGLPQVNAANEAMRRRMDALFGDGWRYTYLHPGLQKVIQAAGRVIRGPQDRGVVHLIDDRFARQDVCEVLPAWWRLDER